MCARLRNLREAISGSLWAVPLALVALACGLATVTLWIDEVTPSLAGLRPWLFGGSASAARDFLATIAGSLITVVALAFSTTIIAIQQASTQFSPRVIRNFMRDRGNQIVFGIYLATFVYALLILRQVRAEEGRGDEFVPALSVTLGLLLALLCVGLLIYFIHHTASSLQISTIAEAIRRDLRDGMARLYPTEIATSSSPEASPPPRLPDTPPVQTLRAPMPGFLRHVEAQHLLDTLPVGVTVACVRPQVGEYVFEGAPLIDIWASGLLARETVDTLLLAFTLGKERNVQQDLLFGIRQLVDIALKALSPGINDPTTAENCLAHLGDTLAQLAARPFPEPWRRHEASGVLLFLNRPDFATIVEVAFGQIRREAADDVHVTNYLLITLTGIAVRIEAPERAWSIRHQAEEVLAALDQQPFTTRDQAFLRERAVEVFAATDLALVGRQR